MKKIQKLICAMVLMMALPAMAQIVSYSMNWQQRNAINSNWIARNVVPVPGDDCVPMMLQSVDYTIYCYAIGSGLSMSGGKLVANIPAMGTAAAADVPTSGNATAGQVVLGADTRLTDARAPLAHTHVIADVTGLQSTLDGKQATIGFTPYNATNPVGYITSAALTGYATTGSLSGYATTSELTTGLAGKLNTPTGTAAQYVRGDGTLATLPATPTVPTINRVRATTAADGTYAWTLPTACPTGTLPIVSITPESATAGDAVSHRIVSTTNTTVNVFAGRSAGLTVLSLTVLGVPTGATIPLHMIAICP